MQYHQFRAMNTIVVLGAECERIPEVFDLAQNFIEGCERRFSRFLEGSELSALNRSAGSWFSASPEMMELMTAAWECHLATAGLFNPAILPNLQSAGYNRSLEQIFQLGADEAPKQPLFAVLPFSEAKLDAANQRIFLPQGMQIDLGGIAKGWIAEKAAQLMSEYCATCAVNAGGDMFLIGQPQGRDHWEIGLEDPLTPSQDLMTLLVEDGAVATSTTTKRRWTQGGLPQHHLIDPRSGISASSPWLSVTVFAPAAVRAETFAKALLIAGPENAKTLLELNPDISFLAVDAERQVWKSPTEKERIYEYA